MNLQGRAIEDARAMFEAAVRAVQADCLLTDEVLRAVPFEEARRVRVAGMGKAAMAMAGVLEAHIGVPIDEGVVVVPDGYPAHYPSRLPTPRRIEVMEGRHPVPNAASEHAGRSLRILAEACEEDDLLLVLISGGGSALAIDLAQGIPLVAAQSTVRLLLESGAPISAINVVRKHLSRIKGGQLARAAIPASTVALVVSDVVGDDLSTIASGPTVPDPTTFDEAVAALRAHGIWARVPEAVRRHLQKGQAGAVDETPKPAHELFERVETHLIGTNRHALEAAARAARDRDYETRVLGSDVTGEARTVGRSHARAMLDAAGDAPLCLLWGGEPTVTVTGDGRGGRNQEAALAAALVLDGAAPEATFLSGGTDGIDGPTDAAGAWVTPSTVHRARARGLDPHAHLDDNDAYPFFAALDQLLYPGPTHTNVMDVQVGVVRSGAEAT